MKSDVLRMAMSDQTGNSAERALLDYLDGLLHDAEPVVAAPQLRESQTVAVVTPMANVRGARPVRLVEPLQTFTEPPRSLAEPLPYAEPPRLRIPLPPVAPPIFEPVVEPAAPSVAPVAPVVGKAPPPATQIEPPSPAVELAVEPAAAPVEAVRPAWDSGPVECLLFKSGGLTLAVPLVELGSIYPLEAGDLTEIFGQIDWFLGLMRTKYGNVRVVDSARVVMPERYRDEMAAAYAFVLTLNGSDWGLGIDAIDGTALIAPTAVKWRTDRSKRPWLAGTVVDKMCALLDAAQLRTMFDQRDRKRTPAGLQP